MISYAQFRVHGWLEALLVSSVLVWKYGVSIPCKTNLWCIYSFCCFVVWTCNLFFLLVAVRNEKRHRTHLIWLREFPAHSSGCWVSQQEVTAANTSTFIMFCECLQREYGNHKNVFFRACWPCWGNKKIDGDIIWGNLSITAEHRSRKTRQGRMNILKYSTLKRWQTLADIPWCIY